MMGKNDDITENCGNVTIETFQLSAENKFKPNDTRSLFPFR